MENPPSMIGVRPVKKGASPFARNANTDAISWRFTDLPAAPVEYCVLPARFKDNEAGTIGCQSSLSP